MFTWLASIALAGTIQVHADTPVTYVLDGKVVGRLQTDITLTDIPEGAHSIRVENNLGSAIASLDFILSEIPARYELVGNRLIELEELIERPTGARNPVPESQLDKLEHRMARKKKDEKKLKRLAEVASLYWFEMRHVDRLLLGLDTLEGRVLAAQMLAPRTIDPEKTKAIEDHFPPGNYRDRAMRAFERYKRLEVEEE
jgi:hypothetical protein